MRENLQNRFRTADLGRGEDVGCEGSGLITRDLVWQAGRKAGRRADGQTDRQTDGSLFRSQSPVHLYY